jgi:flagellin
MMSGFINFGVSPYRTVMSLNRVNSLLSDGLERLSTGQRVNRASDDPAGLAVALQLRADDSSASQALRNTNTGISVQVGINGGSDNQIELTFSDVGADALAVNVTAMDLSTASAASAAITGIDNAIDIVAGERAGIGASQSRLTSASNYMSEFQIATRSAHSSIMDADMAYEIAEISRLQVVQSAGIAALAQANNINMSLISLLNL